VDRLRSVDRLEAVRAMAEPHRMTILRLLLDHPRTISGLGELLGKHPAWVRHHVKVLEAAGLVRVAEVRTTRNYTEKFYAATAAAFTVSMLVRPEGEVGSSLVAMVSDDLAIDLLAAGDDSGVRLITAVTGSLDGLIGVRQGLADIAGCHLLDAETGQYNIPYAKHLFPDRDVRVVTLAHREQGMIVAPGNPLSLASLSDAVSSGARLANRNRGSGTRVWLEHALSVEGVAPEDVPGYDHAVDTHAAAAALVAAGGADFAIGISAAAEQYGLGFIPLFRERYDLVMTEEVYGSEEVARVIDQLHTRRFRRSVSSINGYDSESMGDEYRLAV
jgi:putative molybdopterin biosynthesis protein